MEAAFGSSDLGEIKRFPCGKWDVQCFLLREAGLFKLPVNTSTRQTK